MSLSLLEVNFPFGAASWGGEITGIRGITLITSNTVIIIIEVITTNITLQNKVVCKNKRCINRWPHVL